MKIIPMYDNVILKVLPAVELKTGRIILPQNVVGRDHKIINPAIPRGEVIAVGPGTQKMNGEIMPLAVVKGDIVLYSPKGGFDIASPTKDDPARQLRLVMSQSIIAKVEENGEN